MRTSEATFCNESPAILKLYLIILGDASWPYRASSTGRGRAKPHPSRNQRESAPGRTLPPRFQKQDTQYNNRQQENGFRRQSPRDGNVRNEKTGVQSREQHSYKNNVQGASNSRSRSDGNWRQEKAERNAGLQKGDPYSSARHEMDNDFRGERSRNNDRQNISTRQNNQTAGKSGCRDFQRPEKRFLNGQEAQYKK